MAWMTKYEKAVVAFLKFALFFWVAIYAIGLIFDLAPKSPVSLLLTTVLIWLFAKSLGLRVVNTDLLAIERNLAELHNIAMNEYWAMKQQRDELLVALEVARNDLLPFGLQKVAQEKIDAVIAKMKGGA